MNRWGQVGVKMLFIAPGSPQGNGCAKSFNKELLVLRLGGRLVEPEAGSLRPQKRKPTPPSARR